MSSAFERRMTRNRFLDIPLNVGGSWRQRIGFVVALTAMIVAASALVERLEPRHTLIGTLVEYLPNVVVGIDAVEPLGRGGGRFSVRPRTRFVGFPGDEASPVLTPGARVAVTFRNVGERRSVAYRVRLIEAARQ